MTVLVMQPPTLPQMFQEGIPHRRGYGSPQPPPQPLQESTTLPSIRDTFPGFDKADFSDDTSEPASSRDTSAPAAATSLNTSPNAGSIPVATTAEYTHTPSSGHKRHRGPSDDDDSASRRLSQVPRRFDVPHHIEYVEPLSGGRPLPRASEVPSSAVFAPSIDSTAATWPEQQPGRHLPRLRFDREPPASSPHPRAYASDSHPAYHGHPSSSASCNYPGGQHVGPAPHYHGHAGGSGSYHRQSMSAGSIHGFDSAAFPPSSASRSPPSQSMHYHHHSYLEHHHGVVPYYAGGPDYIPAENMMGGNHRSMVGYGPGGGSMGGGGMRTGDSRQRKRRGNLPKETTDKLRSWFITHLHHPYPSEDEKQELMRQTGLQMSTSHPPVCPCPFLSSTNVQIKSPTGSSTPVAGSCPR